MKIEEQVTNLELSKKLKEFGVKQSSYWYWSCCNGVELKDRYTHPVVQALTINPHWMRDIYSAFTVAELGEMLPKTYYSQRIGNRWGIFEDRVCQEIYEKTEADARAKMLIYLLENKLIKL